MWKLLATLQPSVIPMDLDNESENNMSIIGEYLTQKVKWSDKRGSHGQQWKKFRDDELKILKEHLQLFPSLKKNHTIKEKVSSQRFNFDDGVLNVSKFRGVQFSIINKQHGNIFRKTVIDAVPTGTKSVKIFFITSKRRSVTNRRGGRLQLSTDKKQREVYITWKSYKIKALLADFHKYSIILYLSSQLALKRYKGEYAGSPF